MGLSDSTAEPAQTVQQQQQPQGAGSGGDRWFDIIQNLWNTADARKEDGLCDTLRLAAQKADADEEWSSSGVSAHLDSALAIAKQGDSRSAISSALGLLDFVSIQSRQQQARKPLVPGPASSNAPGRAERLASCDDMPWASLEQEPQLHKSRSWDACVLGNEALHASGAPDGEAAQNSRPASPIAARNGNGTPRAATAAAGSGSDLGARELRKSLSDPEDKRPQKRHRADSPPPVVPRSLSDPCAMRRSRSALLSRLGLSSSSGAEPAGSGSPRPPDSSPDGVAASAAMAAPDDEGFPGHNSVEDVHPDGKLLRQAKNASDEGASSTRYWAGKVKHRLGSSTVELFFLSALLPTAVIEHMPPNLFVTDLVQRSSLAIGSEHTVIRCRLDFLTNRQLRKLRTLAELRLAAVSQLQHCAITLVPYLDAQRGLRIIGFVKVDQS